MHAMYDVSFSESYSEPAASQLAVSSIDGGERRRRAVLHPLPRPQLQRRDPQRAPGDRQLGEQPDDRNPAELTLTQYNLNGSGAGTPVSLKGLLEVIDNAIEIDFGTGGIGGNAGTTTADGYYALSFTPPSGQGHGSTHHFYRLLGDVNGDGTVDQNDLNEIAAARGQSVSQIATAIDQPATGLTPLSMDVNGDGSVNTTDLAAGDEVQGQFARERTAAGIEAIDVQGRHVPRLASGVPSSLAAEGPGSLSGTSQC